MSLLVQAHFLGKQSVEMLNANYSSSGIPYANIKQRPRDESVGVYSFLFKLWQPCLLDYMSLKSSNAFSALISYSLLECFIVAFSTGSHQHVVLDLNMPFVAPRSFHTDFHPIKQLGTYHTIYYYEPTEIAQMVEHRFFGGSRVPTY